MDQNRNLDGEWVRLRPLELSDAEALHEIYREPQTMQFYGKPVCATLDESRRLIDQMLTGQADGTGCRWAILRRTESDVVGSIGFHGWNRDRGFAFFSYEIVPHRGKRSV
jgi:RimJ/RimL family protein N-acetyltransferase